jgi:hypothetical protein
LWGRHRKIVKSSREKIVAFVWCLGRAVPAPQAWHIIDNKFCWMNKSIKHMPCVVVELVQRHFGWGYQVIMTRKQTNL